MRSKKLSQGKAQMIDDLKSREDKLRREYMRNDAAMLLHIVAVFISVLAIIVVGLTLFGGAEAHADDLSLVNDLLPEGDGIVIGRVGDEHINLQKIGKQVTGSIGDKSVYIYDGGLGDWEWKSGHVGDESINVHKWDFDQERDDEG